MPIVLGNDTITGLGVGGLPDGTINAADLAAASVTAAKMGYAGAILQVKSTFVSSVNTTTNVDARTIGGTVGLEVSITPVSSNSQFLILCDIGIGFTAGNTYAVILSRNNSKIGGGDVQTNNASVWFRGPNRAGSSGADSNHGVGSSGMFLDTTSGTAGTAISYKANMSGEGSPTGINRVLADYTVGDGGATAVSSRCSSSITVMEILK
jgi:hypothetical protein